MIQRILRPLWLPVLLALMLWSFFQLEQFLSWGAGDLGLESATGPEAAAANDDSISIGGFLKDTVNPWVFALAFVAAWIFGRAKGVASGVRFIFGVLGREQIPVGDGEKAERFLSASRALAAAGRGLLWGSVLLGVYYVSGLPWTSSRGDMDVASARHLRYVMSSGLLILVIGPLYLLPLAKRARVLSQAHLKHPSDQGSPALDVVDLLMSVALLGLSFLPVITAFQARIVGSEETPSYYTIHWPVIEGVSPQLVVWSFAFVVLFAGLALLPNLGAGQRSRTWRQYGNLAFTSGTLGVLIVFSSGLKTWFMNGGGQADYQRLRLLTGESLTPLFVGILILGITRVLGRSAKRSVAQV